MTDINCNIPAEFLPFDFFGYCLREPMALILNTLIAITCFVFYFRLKGAENSFQKNWRIFFLIFGVSTFLGGFGHLLYNYLGLYGKIPTWILAIIANYFPGKAMLSLNGVKELTKKKLEKLLIFKMVVFFGLMLFVVLVYQKNSFAFVMADSAITFLFYCLGLSLSLKRKGYDFLKYIIYGVLTLIPSIFIFTFKLNIDVWFNKDDLSHTIMIITLMIFFMGVKRAKGEQLKLENN